MERQVRPTLCHVEILNEATEEHRHEALPTVWMEVPFSGSVRENGHPPQHSLTSSYSAPCTGLWQCRQGQLLPGSQVLTPKWEWLGQDCSLYHHSLLNTSDSYTCEKKWLGPWTGCNWTFYYLYWKLGIQLWDWGILFYTQSYKQVLPGYRGD